MRFHPRCAILWRAGHRPGGNRIFLRTLGPILLLTACAQPQQPTPPAPEAPAIMAAPAASSTAPTAPSPLRGDTPRSRSAIDPILDGPTVPLQIHRLRTGGTTLTILTFDSRNHHLAVVDNENGPGTGASTSRDAALKSGAIAAINAGFFTPEGKPLGLVIENGRRFGTLNSSTLGAGLYVRDHRLSAPFLRRRTPWPASIDTQDLLQSGPFLVERGKSVSGLSDSRPRPRSFLLWNNNRNWAIGHANSSTLAGLAATLAAQPVPDFTINSALNLDGGTSSDLWIASSVKGGPASTRHFWNKPVRNYLVLQRNRP